MAKAPTILFLHFGGEWMRGSEFSLLSIVQGLQRQGYSCLLRANREHYVEIAAEQGIQAEQLDFPYIMLDPGELSLQAAGAAGLVLKLYRLIKRQGVDLVYCNGGRPAQAAYFAARLARVPVLCHVRAPYITRYIHLFNLNRCDTTIFVSDATRQFHTARARFKNVVTIHNGVAEEALEGREQPLPELPRNDAVNSITLCQVGALVKEKGATTLLDALTELKRRNIRPRLYLVGRGRGRAHIEHSVRDRGLENQVHCLGELRNVAELLQDHVDVNVLAADWEEPFGRVIVEGYFAGKPVLASRAGGIPEIVEQGKTGYLFERGDSRDLADCIQTLHADRDAIVAMGQYAREYARERFSEEALVRKVKAVIDNTLNSR